MSNIDDDEQNTPRAKADALIAWAGGSTRKPKDLGSALYTLSEAGQFEEESISVGSALLVHSVIEKLKANGGELPDEFHL